MKWGGIDLEDVVSERERERREARREAR